MKVKQSMRDSTYDDTVGIAGVPTFFRAPFIPVNLEELKKNEINVGVLGVPFEGGCTGRPGSSYCPHAVRTAMWQFSSYLYDLDVDLVDHYRIADCGDVPVNPVSVKKTHRMIADYMRIIYNAGAIPIMIGGDHSVSTGGIMCLSEATDGPIGLLVLDAHLDTAESVGGEEDSGASFEASVIRNIPNLDAKNVAIIGPRGATCPRSRWEYCEKNGVTVLSMPQVVQMGVEAAIKKCLDVVQDGTKNFYVSYDTDAIDPAFAPGTGAPEPGGFTSREILRAAELIGRAKPGAFDLVELGMSYDPSGITASLACFILYYMLAARVK
jgi:agmatinase